MARKDQGLKKKRYSYREEFDGTSYKTSGLTYAQKKDKPEMLDL